MTHAFITLLIPFGIIFFAGVRVWRDSIGWPLGVAISLAIGWGGASIAFFLWSITLGPRYEGLVGLELALLAMAIMGALTFYQRNGLRPSFEFTHDTGSTKTERIGGALVIIVLFLMVAQFINVTLVFPHGAWDAWSMWNLKARFLSRGGADWDAFFSLPWAHHPDYPLGISSLVASRWAGYAHHDSTAVPQLVAFGYVMALPVFLYSGLKRFTGHAVSLLACAILISTGNLFSMAAGQLADVPLSLHYLGFMVLYFFAISEDENSWRRFFAFVLAGGLLGLSVWIKNEGMLFLLASFIALSIFQRRAFVPILLGALPGLLALILLKTLYPQSNDIFSASRIPEIMNLVTDPVRYATIIIAMLKGFFSFGALGKMGIPFGAGLFLLVGVGLFLYRRGTASLGAIAPLLATLFITMTGVGIVYLVSPHKLNWHITLSLDRILMQLWPATVFTFFALIAPEGDTKQEAK